MKQTVQREDLLSSLSRREVQVLEMAALGLRNREIASRLDVTTHAVKFHLSGTYRKLGVGNRVEAVIALMQRQELKSNS